MSKGSKRITIRVGLDLFEEILRAVNKSKEGSGSTSTMSEFIVQAICEKLSHKARSRRVREKTTAKKMGEFEPREFVVEEY